MERSSQWHKKHRAKLSSKKDRQRNKKGAHKSFRPKAVFKLTDGEKMYEEIQAAKQKEQYSLGVYLRGKLRKIKLVILALLK